MTKINSRRVKRVFSKIPKSLKYLILLTVSVLFILEFVIFPPLSAQIEHGSFTYQSELEKIFDNTIPEMAKQEYPPTTIKAIRHNPTEYIDEKVSITGYLDMPFPSFTLIPRLVQDDYVIYFDRRLELKSQLNVRGLHVRPDTGVPGFTRGDLITVKGKIIYDETESVLIEPHEVLYDGLTWSIKQP